MNFQSILLMAGKAIIVTGIIAFIIALLVSMNHRTEKKNVRLIFGWVWYLGALFYVTIGRYGLDMEVQFALTNRMLNLYPIINMITLLNNGAILEFLYNLIGNILWFVPLGMLLHYTKPKLKAIHVLLIGAMLSISIECIQYLLVIGTADIDDVLCNLMGGLLGYWVMICLIKRLQNYLRLK